MLAISIAPIHAQDWDGTVEVSPPTLDIAQGESGTYRLRLSKPPTRNGPNGNGWWIMVHADGGVGNTSEEPYEGLSWIPSVGWEFKAPNPQQTDEEWTDDQSNWREIRITVAADAAVGTQVTFTHEVWDQTTDCPVHDASPVTVRVVAKGTTNDNNGGNGGNGNPSQPSLAIDDVTVAENGGTAVFTVRLKPQSDSSVSVAYATADGSATAGEDYATKSETVNFPAGDTVRTIAVTILDDSDPEAIEEFVVTLSNPQNAALLEDTGTATITDNDDDDGTRSPSTPSILPKLSIRDVTVREHQGPAILHVSLDKGSTETVTVAYATADGSATAGADYAATSGMLTFQRDETSKTIVVAVLDDSDSEGHETFTVRLSNPRHAYLSDSEGTATIRDDEYDGVRVSYGAASYSVAEGSSVKVDVGLSAAPGRPVTIDLTQLPGAAAGTDDYSGVPASVRFDSSESRKSFRFVAENDKEDDDGEFVTLGFGPLPADVIAGVPVQSTVTIADTPPRVVPVPEDWLREFGRTAVAQVVDALDERMRCARDRRPGAAMDDDDGSRWRCAQDTGPVSFAIDGRVLDRLAAAADATGVTVVRSEPHRPAAADLSVGMPSGSALLAASAKKQNQLGMSVWGRGSYSRFERDDALPLGGDVWTATFGADFAFRQAVAGVALSHSESEGTASQDGVETDVTSVLTGFYPYLRVGVNDRLSLWGTVGLGTGTLIHSMNGAPSLRTGIAMTMAAAGGLAEVISPTGSGGLSVAIKADGLLLEIESDGSPARPSAALDASRLRLVVESAYEFVLRDRQRIAPFLEIGGRLDGADAQDASGLGFEVGGGVRYAHPLHHLTAEVYSRALLVHAANGFKGWSASGTLRYDPRSNSAQGPYLTVTSSRGFGGLGGQVALGLAGLTNAAAFDDSDAGWGIDTEFGYGVPIPGGAATGTPWAGLSLSQGRPEYRLGYRLQYETGLHLSLAATLRDGNAAHEPPRSLLTLLLSLR